jgi:hypothetical protein
VLGALTFWVKAVFDVKAACFLHSGGKLVLADGGRRKNATTKHALKAPNIRSVTFNSAVAQAVQHVAHVDSLVPS